MARRPTLEDLQAARGRFIGPPLPPQEPKMQRRMTAADDAYMDALVTFHPVKQTMAQDEASAPARVCHAANMLLIKGFN